MSYLHISKEERIELRGLLKTNLDQADIARILHRNPGSLSREIQKGGGRKGYSVKLAEQVTIASHRRANQRCRKMGSNTLLTEQVVSLLELKWSPEQIVGRTALEVSLGLVAADTTTLCAQTIYTYVNADPRLAKLLPRGHTKYRRRHGISAREKKRAELSPKRNIATRDAVVEARTRLGDWEGDTIVGSEKKERILTHVERKSGYLLAAKTKDGTAPEIRSSTETCFKRIPQKKKCTITLDNGVEFAEWELTEQHTKTTIYFANPYHSWERGTSENTNGLIRRDYPKGTPFATLTTQQLNQTVYRINHRPRKRLGYQTPNEVFKGIAVRTLI